MIWNGPIGHTGYGIFSKNIIRRLVKRKHNLYVLPAYSDELRVTDDDIREIVRDTYTDIKQLDADVAIRLSIANPSDAMSFYAKNRVLFSMLEVDKIPPYWVSAMNTMDQVWTPSEWGKEVFINSGVNEEKVKVVPGGVDTNIFNPYRKGFDQIEKMSEDKFKFFMCGKFERRKGYDILLKAFSEEFDKDEDVELYLNGSAMKIFDNNFNIYKNLWNMRLPENRARINVIEGGIPDYRQMGRLYNSFDCFVKPTRGEGWNLPLIESMACGVPAIVTNWSAHTDYANNKNAYMLEDFEIVKPDLSDQVGGNFLQFGEWAEPSVDELKKTMRHVFENQDEAKKKGEKAAKDMENWTWDNSAEKVIEHVKEMVE